MNSVTSPVYGNGRKAIPSYYNQIQLFYPKWSYNRSLMIIHVQILMATVTTNRLLCNMTYLGQHVTSSDLDLRPIVDPTVQSHHAYVSTRLGEGNTMVPKYVASILSSKVICKKLFFCQKRLL